MYTLTQAKDLVINQGYAICNDDTVEKLNEVMSYIEEKDVGYIGLFRYYSLNDCDNIHNGDSINLSEIELPKQITIEMVIELTKKHTNDMELGSELRKLLNN